MEFGGQFKENAKNAKKTEDRGRNTNDSRISEVNLCS